MGKQKVKENKVSSFQVYRDGDFIGAGMSKVEADSYVDSMKTAYPDSNFKIVPVKTGNKE